MARVVSIFANQLLADCAAAFAKRGKAIRYRSTRLAIARRPDEEQSECLEVDVTTGVRSSQVRLVVWPTGDLWFRVATPGTRRGGGWEFLMEFRGEVGALAPDELVSMFEQSLLEATVGDHGTAAARIIRVWARANPEAAG